MSKINATCAATLGFLLLSACAVGPDYQKPNTKIDEQWNTYNNGVKTTPTQDAAWWKTFHDPILNNLIEIGYKNNLTLQSAGAKVLQSKAQLAQSVGELYPQQQGASGNYTRERLGGGGSIYGANTPSDFNIASSSVSSSWELDFWGKYRRAIRANDATFFASIAAYDDALVSLTAEIGSAYIAIRMYQTQIYITEKNITLQKENFKMTQVRYDAGKADLSDVEQANTTLAQTEASLPPLKIDLQQQKDALAVLLGTTPNKVDALLGKNKSRIPVAPSSVAVGIPKDVLRQRPDVHQAELEAIAQSEGIGAIKAQLYPAFSLSGSFGYSASNIGQSSPSDIFQWSNHTYSVGPSVSIPLFNYGQITNQVRAQDAAFQAAIFNYQNVVLTAQKEVQDGIVSYVESQKALKSMIAANEAAIKTTQLSITRYEAGEIDYSSVIDAEKNQLSVQMSLINAQNSVPQGLISLYRALGGGWQIRKGHDVVSDDVKKEMKERTNWGSVLDDNKAPSTVLPSW
ncbi:MAG: efflux transporter outer membrane subunit [Pseudomonadota bacterium]